MPTINYSQLAEIEMRDEWLEDEDFKDWLKTQATFIHADSYEFIHHLFLDETEEQFIKDWLSDCVPGELKDLILEARRSGAARICFFA
jgi:hypothetical protein